jgi:signal transduction protein with GAF and PtsI domain
MESIHKEPSVPKLNQAAENRILRRIVDLTSSELGLQPVLDSIVDILVEATAAESVFVYLYDPREKALVLKASKTPHKKELGTVALKMGEGITGWVAREHKTVSIDEQAYHDPRFKGFDVLPEDRYEAFLSVPINYKGRVTGVINIQHRNVYRHSKNLVTLIASIAGLVGGVIENARLYEENKNKARQFDSLAKVSTSITSKKYLDEILNLIVVVTAEMLDSKICSIMLIDESGENLVIKASQSLSVEYRRKPPVRLKSSLSGEVIREKQPRAVYDVTKERNYYYRDLAVKENLSSVLLIPMIIRDKAIGIINVYTKTHHEFTPDEINALQMVANQAAVAIENTQLIAEALAAREALETRKLVERAKGVLMKIQGLSEDEAHRTIHRKSMDTGNPMKEIAEAIILMAELTKRG